MWSLSGSTIITRSLHAETDMRDDRQEISDLIRAWVSAVRAGDLEGVLSAHAEDIVMFDVPSPDNGVRGIDAYRETWPPFFGWLRSGASFDIVELDVTAGDDVAYAWALLRCGTEDEFRKGPDNRLPDHRTAKGRRTLGRVPRASLVPGQSWSRSQPPALSSLASTSLMRLSPHGDARAAMMSRTCRGSGSGRESTGMIVTCERPANGPWT
jgi:ketosteroid isomerase-like protein